MVEVKIHPKESFYLVQTYLYISDNSA